MKGRAALLALMFCLAPFVSHGQVPAAPPAIGIIGNLKDLGANNPTSASTYVLFTLQNYGSQVPTIPGTGVIVNPNSPPFKPDSQGRISGNLYPNDVIAPPGTYYQVCVFNQGVSQWCQTYVISSGLNPWNLNTAIPIVTTPPPFNSIMGAQTSFCLNSVPSTSWTCNHNFGNQVNVVQCSDLSGFVFQPDRIQNVNTQRAIITFQNPTVGTCVIMHAGLIAFTNTPSAILSDPAGPQVIGNGMSLEITGALFVDGGFGINPGPVTFASLGTVARTATLPDNSGQLAELNYTQTWSGQQTFNVGILNSPAINGTVSGNPNFGGQTSFSGAITGTVQTLGPWILNPQTSLSMTFFGQPSLTGVEVAPATTTGATQQVAFAAYLPASSTTQLLNGQFRIAGLFDAETRTGGEAINPLNVIAYSRVVDPPSLTYGEIVYINNFQSSSALNCIPPACYIGVSVNSGGSGIGSYAVNVAASGPAGWQQGIEIDQGSIAGGGYAFDYKGDGANGSTVIRTDTTLEVGIASNLGGASEIHLSNSKPIQGLASSLASLIPIAQINNSNFVELGSLGVGVQFDGHIQQAATKQFAGTCTENTNCNVSFVQGYASIPVCVSSDMTGTTVAQTTPSTSGVVLSGGGAGHVFGWICVGNPN